MTNELSKVHTNKRGDYSKGRVLKRKLLQALYATAGNIKEACIQVNISRRAFYKWKASDEIFARKYEQILEERVDIAETKLCQAIEDGNLTAIIFFLKCKAKDRGYVEKDFREFMQTLPIPNAVIKVLEQFEVGEIDAKKAAIQLAKNGFPLPEVIKLELQKQKEPDAPLQAWKVISDEELDRNTADAMAKALAWKDVDLPKRRDEVVRLEQELTGNNPKLKGEEE